MTCSIDGCVQPLIARGWCVAHYAKWRKYGDPLAVFVRPPKRLCSVDGCSTPTHAKALCGKHYAALKQRVYRRVARNRTKDLLARISFTEGCWGWTGDHLPSGYGRFYFRGERSIAHRAVFEALRGKVPAGLVLDHLCRNRGCVNPWHLEPVTDAVNILRGVGPPAMNAKKTHCVHGHEFTPENTIARKDGRECRACRDRRSREFKARKRAA